MTKTIKTPAKAAAKPVAPKPIKIGAAVVATTSRSAIKFAGRFAGSRKEPSGLWVDVNVAPKGKPAQIKSFRPAQVVLA